MRLKVEERLLIQQSFARLDQQGEAFAHYFFDLLFEMAPLVKPMFISDRSVIEKHFYEVFATAVEKIESFQSLEPILLQLGENHATYGVKKEQFKVVKSVLLLSIDFMLANHCNQEVLEAWGHYFDCLAEVMLRGMELAPASA